MQAIIVQTFIAAPAERVFAALDQHAALLFDGLPAKAWPKAEDQPPYNRKVAWPFTGSAGGATSVELVLHEVGGGTRLDVRHSGWGEGPAWDEAIQGHFAGWLQGLASLGLALETGLDPRATPPRRAEPRYFISGEIPAGSAAVYRSLTDAQVRSRWAGNLLAGAEALEQVENRFIRWQTRTTELTMILRDTPRGTHLALAEYGVSDKAASQRWPKLFEALATFLG